MYNDCREIDSIVPFLRTDQTGSQQLETGGKEGGGRGALIAFESGYHTVHQLPVFARVR